jgi:hypothetical protein
MTAQVFTANVKPASLLSLCKYEGEGATKIDATADSALAAITTSSTVNDVLDILSACVARSNAVTANSIGLATSVRVGNGPTDIALSAATVAVGAVGTTTPVTVGTISSTQIDGVTPTYTLVTGTGSTNNTSFSISGTSLRYIGAAATAGSLSIRIRATDSTGQTYEEAFTITVA